MLRWLLVLAAITVTVLLLLRSNYVINNQIPHGIISSERGSEGHSIIESPYSVRDGGRKVFEINFQSGKGNLRSSNAVGEATATSVESKPIEFISEDVLQQHKSHNAAAPKLAARARRDARVPASKRKPRKVDKDIEFMTEEEQSKHKPDSNIHFKTTGSSSITSIGSSSSSSGSPGGGRIRGRGRGRKGKAGGSSDVVELHELSIENPHPPHCPRAGTDISPEHHMAILTCPNQSKCVVPQLQLKRKFKVYYCRHPTRIGVRYYYLAREGFLLHPNVELVPFERIDEADFIVYLPGSAPWHLTECNNTAFGPRVLVLDEFDGHSLVMPTIEDEEYERAYGNLYNPWYFMYFKRSFVRRYDGEFRGYPHLSQPDVYPMVYAVAEAYVQMHFNFKRDIEILCSLRGHTKMPTRQRTQNFVAEYGVSRKLKNFVAGEVNTVSRKSVSVQYFQQMYNAQIIVTVNPAFWEGDFRLWEAMCTGALVFVDPLFVPHPHPLIGGQHVVFFDNNNKSDLFHKLDYYRSNEVEARRIAIAGYLHAMKYHRTVNMVDYFLRSAHTKQAMLAAATAATSAGGSGSSSGAVLPHYTYTGQYLNHEAHLQEADIKRCHMPGVYEEKNLSHSHHLLPPLSQSLVSKVICSKRQRSDEVYKFEGNAKIVKLQPAEVADAGPEGSSAATTTRSRESNFANIHFG